MVYFCIGKYLIFLYMYLQRGMFCLELPKSSFHSSRSLNTLLLSFLYIQYKLQYKTTDHMLLGTHNFVYKIFTVHIPTTECQSILVSFSTHSLSCVGICICTSVHVKLDAHSFLVCGSTYSSTSIVILCTCTSIHVHSWVCNIRYSMQVYVAVANQKVSHDTIPV